jgi:SM-20-related protein
MEALRKGLNERLFLGLFDYECHYARYAPGASYQTHRDAFAGGGNRVLSTVLYLNEGWLPEQGGELVLYHDDAGRVAERILPRHNRLVVFLSERFPHEVKAGTRTRYSLTGWFRTNSDKSRLRPV